MKIEKIIYHLTNRGTFSEINNLIICYAYSKYLGVPFFIDDRTWSGKFDKGYTDYFQEDNIKFYRKGLKLKSVLGNTANGSAKIFNYMRVVVNFAYKKIFLLLNKFLNSKAIFTPDYFEKARLQSKTPYYINGKIIKPDEYLYECANEIIKYNKELQNYISNKIKETQKILSNKFIGLHIRRGDKINNQMGVIQISMYVEIIYNYNIKSIFIATDDYQVIYEIRKLLPCEYKIFTLSDDSSNGWVENDFRKRNGMMKKKEMYNLFTDVEILIKSEIFIGTFSSCIGQYININRRNKVSISIDNNFYFE